MKENILWLRNGSRDCIIIMKELRGTLTISAVRTESARVNLGTVSISG